MVEARDTHDTDDVDSAQAPDPPPGAIPDPPPGAIPDPPPAAQIEEFFRRYWQGLVHSLQREGANLWEAQDAVAEAIREALRRWSELTHPVAWVRTAARSHWLKQRRSAGHGDVEVLVADVSELGAGRADPELVAYELQEWFAGVLAQLPPARREALELSAQGLTPAEIAQLVGKTPEAVRTALKLGRKQAVAMWQAVPSQRGPAPARTTEPESRDPVAGRTTVPESRDPVAGRTTVPEPRDPVAGRTTVPEPRDPVAGRTTVPEPRDPVAGRTTEEEPRGPVSGRTSEPEGDRS